MAIDESASIEKYLPYQPVHILLIVLLVGPLALICFIGAPLSNIFDYNLAYHGKATTGEVFAISSTSSKTNQTVYRAHVTYTVSGKKYQAILSSGLNFPQAKHTVYYAPLWPAYASLDTLPPPPSTIGVALKLFFCLLFGLASLAQLSDVLHPSSIAPGRIHAAT